MQHQDLDCDGRPYQRMPRHAPPPPVTPVDPYAATEPVLTETLEQAEVPLPPAAGAAALCKASDAASFQGAVAAPSTNSERTAAPAAEGMGTSAASSVSVSTGSVVAYGSTGVTGGGGAWRGMR